jgi:hypothetical protein
MKRKRTSSSTSSTTTSSKKDTPPSKKQSTASKKKKKTSTTVALPYPPVLFHNDVEEEKELLTSHIVGPLFTHVEHETIAYDELDDEEDTDDNIPTHIDVYEPALVNDYKLLLPIDAFDFDVLNQVLSMDTWNKLTAHERMYLKQFLPYEKDEAVTNETLKRLLTGENMLFGNDKIKFIDKLVSGYYHPLVTRERNKVLWLSQKNHQVDMCIQNAQIQDKLNDEKMDSISPEATAAAIDDEEEEEEDDNLMILGE